MNPKLSLIILTFNERENIQVCLDNIKKSFSGSKIHYEIVIVDDNSADGTYEYVKKFSKTNKNVRLFSRKNQKGFGSAMSYGLKMAKGTFLIPFMADLSDNPEDAKKLYYKIRQGYDVIFTNRFRGGNRAYDYPRLKYCFNRIYNLIISFLFGVKFTDTSNAFKAFRKDIIDRIDITAEGFEVTTELAIKAYFRGKKFSEMPVSWHNREKGKQKSNLFKVGVGYAKILLLLLNEKYKK